MPTKKPSPATAPSITPERIAERAYELFLERGGHAGYHVEDWLRAEQELSGGNGEAPVADAPKTVRKRATTATTTEKPKAATPRPAGKTPRA